MVLGLLVTYGFAQMGEGMKGESGGMMGGQKGEMGKGQMMDEQGNNLKK